MHVVRISVANFGPFKGGQKLVVGPTVYGIVARHQSDAGRSNWLGKSWAMNAVRYALYGAHSAQSEDDVIHRGQDSAVAEIELSDGTVVTRTRPRGKSTQLVADIAGGGKKAKQDAAQSDIIAHLKMTLDDFDASCFIKQKQIDRMIQARPAERTDIVNAWLELHTLIEAEDLAKSELAAVIDKRSTIEAKIGALNEVAAQMLNAEECFTNVERLEDEVRRITNEHEAANAKLVKERERQRYVEKAEEFNELVKRGRELKDELKAVKPPSAQAKLIAAAEEKYTRAQSELTIARVEEGNCRRLSEGEFDGECPVMRKPCPARDAVESTRVDAATRLLVLQQETAKCDEDVGLRRKEVYEHRENEREVARLEQAIESVRERAEALADADDYVEAHPSLGDLEELDEAETILRDHLIDASTQLRMAKKQYDDWLAARDAVKKLKGPELRRLDDKIATAKEAIAVFKAVRKKYAKQALADIEKMANELLTRASIDLTLAVSWAREGKGLATHCESCGAPFGSSQKVTSCAKCGTARGPKLIDRLDIVLSNKSGAADDIAGMAFQLAASAWLRNRRGSDWGTVFIDEPFGALDETNTRNLSNHLHAMIRGAFGFEQGFLVAHHSAIMSAMPARIVVTSDGVSSVLAVE